jgi:hypothetical protein
MGTPRATAAPAGEATTSHHHLIWGENPGLAPGQIRTPRGRGQDNKNLLIFADPHPTVKMGVHNTLQATKAPDSSAVLERSRSLPQLPAGPTSSSS